MGGDDDLPELSPEALARAEAALAALTGDYLDWARADLAKLRAALSPFTPGTLFTVAHDIKGQAGTFGYPRVTDLANRLCRLVEADPSDRAQAAELVQELAHELGE